MAAQSPNPVTSTAGRWSKIAVALQEVVAEAGERGKVSDADRRRVAVLLGTECQALGAGLDLSGEEIRSGVWIERTEE